MSLQHEALYPFVEIGNFHLISQVSDLLLLKSNVEHMLQIKVRRLSARWLSHTLIFPAVELGFTNSGQN